MSQEQFYKDAQAIQERVGRDTAAAWSRLLAELKRVGEQGSAAIDAAGRKNGVTIRSSYRITMRGMSPEHIDVRVSVADGLWSTP